MRLDPVKPIYQHDGPFVTVVVNVSRDSEDAVSQLDARWTTLRHQLEHAGVAAGLVSDIGDRVQENTHVSGEVWRTLVAAGDAVVFDDVRAGHTHWPEVFDIGSLPDLSAWLAAADAAKSFLLVNVDRVGADISIHDAVAGPALAEQSVNGDDFYITKVAEGDWAQKQFQQTAENTWKQNAELVADHVRTLARGHATEATLIAGETRARSEVAKALGADPAVVAPVIDIESGGRAAGASDSALWTEITSVMTALSREDDTDVAAELDRALGQGVGAVSGVDDVVGALTRAQAQHVVLDLSELEDRTVAVADLSGLALPAGALAQERLPAGRTLVAAAALTDAEVTLLPSSMGHGGASALLRWS